MSSHIDHKPKPPKVEPSPGSAAAVKQGCTCPVIDNRYGEGVPTSKGRTWSITEGCPLHYPGPAVV